VYDHAVELGFELSAKATAAVETLRETLGVRIRLLDGAFRVVHAHVRQNDWVSFVDRESFPEPSGRRAALVRAVNKRWSLQLTREGHFDGNVERFIAWATKEIAAELSSDLAIELPPRNARVRGAPPRGGGSSSPAELGIPVAWARRSRG
jgi:hypothetical protein